MKISIVSVAASLALLAGCSSMLPRGSSDSLSSFDSYAQAEAAATRVVPFHTRADQLAGLGFDPRDGRNVTVIPYPDIVARLAPYSGVPLDQLDPGIRTCILDRTGCRGYLFRFQREERRRDGGFWADFFNVRRSTSVRGWWFESLIVVSGDQVLFRNIGGQAHQERMEKQANPLGPLQGSGEAVGAQIIR